MQPQQRLACKRFLKQGLYLVGGSLGYALGLNLFLSGNGIAAGGFSGVAIIVNYLVPVPIGLFTFALSLPLFVWAYVAKGKHFVWRTLVCSAIYSLFIDALSFLPTLTNNLMVASVCGGICYGVSGVLLLRGGASGSGTDLLARLMLTKLRHVTLGTMIIIVDGLVVLSSVLVSGDLSLGIYAILSIAVCSYSTDWLIRGFNRAMVFYIITSSDPKVMADKIMYDLDRGVTLLNGKGMYGGEGKSILMVVVKSRQVYHIKDLVQQCDPNAFVVLSAANEIMGEGFDGIDAVKD